MEKVAFITDSFSASYNTIYPIIIYKRALKHYGIQVSLIYDIHDVKSLERFDHIFISNRPYKRKLFDLRTVEKVASLGKSVYWFDESDSTGNTNFEVLPFVRKYLKKQFLRDKGLYGKAWYRDRIFTDYYHKEFGIEDNEAYESECLLRPEDFEKLCLSWNLAYSDKRMLNRWFQKITRKLSPFAFIQWPLPITVPFDDRHIGIFGRMTANHGARTISFHREKCLQFLAEVGSGDVGVVFAGKVFGYKYLEELAHSKGVLSPFGWGEICHRDIEAFLYGCCLIKPDLSYIDTWPGIYMCGQTYIPFKWDFSDLRERLCMVRNEPWVMEEVAERGRKTIEAYSGERGGDLFAEHFRKVIG